ncbi:DUF4236 domain-containing protein [Patescibacteria group bacterium]|nr:MAG: DUF4236 domain-containing protein [Patescibacteria group bacterium]
MAFRFHKSFKIIPGIKLNIGKKGLGVSTGIKGARVGINSKGTYSSVAIPGTGISSLTYHKNKQIDEKQPITETQASTTKNRLSKKTFLILLTVFCLLGFIINFPTGLIITVLSFALYKYKS